MSRYEHGDYVKLEFQSDAILPAEWMWICVDHCDEERQLIFGRLDNEPMVNQEETLGVHKKLIFRQAPPAIPPEPAMD